MPHVIILYYTITVNVYNFHFKFFIDNYRQVIKRAFIVDRKILS